MAEENGTVELLHKIWDWAKKLLTAEDWNNKLLLASDIKERTAWQGSREGQTEGITETAGVG